MRDIHCPKDVGMNNIFSGEDCEREQHFNNCYHCWTSAIAQKNQEYFKQKVLEQELKIGHWVSRWYGDKHFHVCSECQEEFSYDAETGIKITDYHICPNCGSKMESE